MRRPYSLIHRALRKIFYRKIINEFLNDCNTILDAGCGLGDFLLKANSEGKKVIGIDKDKEAINYCKKMGLSATKGDVTNLKKFKNCYFDAIFCSHVIEHLDDPLKTLKEFRRVLKDKGRLIIITPTYYRDFWCEPTHVKLYTKHLLRKILQQAGFKILQMKYDKLYMLKIKDSEVLTKTLNYFPFKWTRMNIIACAQKS